MRITLQRILWKMTARKECLCCVSMSDYALVTYANVLHVPYIVVEKCLVL